MLDAGFLMLDGGDWSGAVWVTDHHSGLRENSARRSRRSTQRASQKPGSHLRYPPHLRGNGLVANPESSI